MIAKRAFDILVSATAIIVLLIPGIIISFIVLVGSKGGAFYIQQRVGKNGRSFGIMKFRTMHVNSDVKGLLTVGRRDPRITRSGYFLRKSKLDELPQLINIFKGDMSLVGPRPEVKKYVDLYTKEQRMVLSVKPGLTDYASIKYFDENRVLAQHDDPERAYIEKIMPEKLALNLVYIDKMSFITDLRILWETFVRIFFTKR